MCINQIGGYIMPLSELVKFEEVEYGKDANGNIAGICFRCTFKAKGVTVWGTSDRSEGNEITIGKFPVDEEQENALRTWLQDTKEVAKQKFYVMLWPIEVTPFTRVYTRVTGNHAEGETICDAEGNPRIYHQIMVPCESTLIDGKEVPKNKAQVESQALKNRAYFIKEGRYQELSKEIEAPENLIDEIPVEEQAKQARTATPPPANTGRRPAV